MKLEKTSFYIGNGNISQGMNLLNLNYFRNNNVALIKYEIVILNVLFKKFQLYILFSKKISDTACYK